MEQMREKYESLSAFVLKDLAKARGIKGVSSLKKGQIIERMLEEDAKEAEEAEKNGTVEERANSFKDDYAALDSGEEAEGILEVMPEGFGFIRCDNYMPGDHDIYVAPAQIRRFNLGRIKYKGQIQKQKDEKTGYVTLADENLRKDYIYNFVAYTFLGKIEGDVMHVHHITNDGYYNTTENLVLLTKDEHSSLLRKCLKC